MFWEILLYSLKDFDTIHSGHFYVKDNNLNNGFPGRRIASDNRLLGALRTTLNTGLRVRASV